MTDHIVNQDFFKKLVKIKVYHFLCGINWYTQENAIPKNDIFELFFILFVFFVTNGVQIVRMQLHTNIFNYLTLHVYISYKPTRVCDKQ
jgi:hypothetical protein